MAATTLPTSTSQYNLGNLSPFKQKLLSAVYAVVNDKHMCNINCCKNCPLLIHPRVRQNIKTGSFIY